jgi:hypothetical protein
MIFNPKILGFNNTIDIRKEAELNEGNVIS